MAVNDDPVARWRDALPAALENLGLPVETVNETMWMTVLEGVHKRSLPVSLTIKEQTLRLSAFLAGPLDEGHETVYRLLLSRNQHAASAHYALDDAAQLVINARVALAMLDPDDLDALLGEVLALADDVFPAVLTHGFAGYIDAEQQWRRNAGMLPNPIRGDARN